MAPINADGVLREERDALGKSDDDGLTALCISGGGIRSATFGLGALQGLAEHGLLTQFDYLSTVSGGGYIGSWLTMWATRLGGRVDAVAPKLIKQPGEPSGNERDPIGHLREFNNYLSPAVGALSADLWTLVATVLRNVILNWLVLVPVLLAVLLIPRAYLAILALPERLFGAQVFAGAQPDYGARALDAISSSPLVWLALPALTMLMLGVALFNALRYMPGIGGRPHNRFDHNVWVLLPLLCSVLAYLLYDSLYYVGDSYQAATPAGWLTAASGVTCLAAWMAFLLTHRERLALAFSWITVAIVAGAGVAGAAAWLVTDVILWNPDPALAPSWTTYVTLGPPLLMFGLMLGTILSIGLTSGVLKDEDREWLARGNAGLLLACVGWLALCTVALKLPEVILGWRTWGAGFLTFGGAISAWLSRVERPAPANVNPGAGVAKQNSAFAAAASMAPLVFVIFLGIALSIVTNALLGGLHELAGTPLAGPHGEAIGWRQHEDVLTRSAFVIILALAFVCAATSWFMSRYVNINIFSLNGMYRDRLVRAYLGASNPNRHPNLFTGFDKDDDTPLAALRDTRPLHVVNVTLNLVETTRLAWQQRKAASFTMTPLHCGSADVGYRDTARYGGGITLGTAVSISGAAASPNMGYHSSPVVGFVMTIFNARLGSWLGNPGRAGEHTWKDAGPRSAMASLLKEALGRTSDNSGYVYLSDGGHFENLGLYEMIRRRCRFIVVLDSGCDPDSTFEDLGNALRKVRIDFGVSIEFDDAQMRAVAERKRRSALATIHYADAPEGYVLYVKPMLLGNEAADVRSYAATNPDFPHQSTSDQWFDESQTESYRLLGLCTIREVCGEQNSGPLPEFFWRLRAEADYRRAGIGPEAAAAPGSL